MFINFLLQYLNKYDLTFRINNKINRRKHYDFFYAIEIDKVYLYLESDKEADDGNDELLVIS